MRAKSLVYEHYNLPESDAVLGNASSAPDSIGDRMFRPERCRLTDDCFQNLMFIRYNTQ